MKNISIAVYDDCLNVLLKADRKKTRIMHKAISAQLAKNPNDRLLRDLLTVCRERVV